MLDLLISLNNFFMLNFSYRVLLFAILGLCIGSFLNVVIYRLPIILERKWYKNSAEIINVEYKKPDNYPVRFNLVIPASMCFSCGKKVGILFNLPLLGFFLARGKCSKCHSKISWQYPLVETITGLLFGIAAYSNFAWYIVLAQLVFISFCLCIIVIDFKTMLLPDELTKPLLWLGLLVNLHGLFAGSLVLAVLGACFGFGLLWLVNYGYKLITKKDGMGEGDFSFLGAISAWVGLNGLIPVILLAASLGIIYFILLYGFKRVKANSAIPFGPFLGVSGIVMLLFGTYIMPLFAVY
jgi:leader peptidase (prepilin peptidase)/N-methyltransferase